MTSARTAAHELHAAGLSVVPVAADGTKRPAIAWKPYTQQPATIEQLDAWYAAMPAAGVGLITGTVSGSLEMLEVEGRAAHELPGLAELAEASGLAELWQRINAGWLELSPSGGVHWFYRLTGMPVPGNTKLAADTDRVTLAETRGEGGFVVLAPTGGTAHPTGRPWVRLTGGPASIPTVTVEERDALHTLIRTIDQTTEHTSAAPTGPVSDLWAAFKPQDGDVTPGDDYEQRTDWSEILTGWTHIFTRGNTRYWRRPGKKDGISATTGHAGDRDRLYVFTSSTEFEPETPYTKFGAYAHLNHGGDHGNAAKQLAADQYGHRAPRALTPVPGRHLVAVPNTAREQPTATGTDPAPSPAAALIGSDPAALTDVGNARLLVAEYEALLRYIPDAGQWASWTGTRWEWAPDDAPALQAALDVAERLPTDNEQIRKHRIRSLSTRSITNVVRLARALPELRTPATEFDTHPWQLNTPGGIVDLATGALTAPTPHLFHSKQTTVTPDPNMPTPLWNKFVTSTFQGNAQMILYMQRLAGLMFIGEVLEHILPFAHGPGGNGKGVFAEVLKGIGGDYATSAPQGFLVVGRDKHETELAKLQGCRIVIASEINENTRFDEAKMKALTGGDTITARFMRKDFFDFIPSHTFLMLGNNQPNVESGGDSVWRRLRLIPFTNKVPEDEMIQNLQQRLVDEEGPGILHWIIQGAVGYAAHGIDTPTEVLAATNEYRAEEDHLARFIDDTCILGGGDHARIPTTELRRIYDAWCRDENEHELNGSAFGRQLRQKFDIGTARSKSKRFYTGIMLQHRDDDPADSEGGLFGGHWSDR